MTQGILSEGYSIMPNILLKDSEISPFAKMLYCLVSSLCAKEGYCFASNKYLQNYFKVSESTIRDSLTELKNYLVFENRTNSKRSIRLAGNPVKNHWVPGEKSLGRDPAYIDNNNINNNILSKISSSPVESKDSTKISPLTELKKFTVNDLEYKSCYYLFAKIRKNRENFMKKLETEKQIEDFIFKSWIKHMDLLHRLDKHDWNEIQEVIDFATKDEFWKTNILSTEKLRKQFETLAMKIKPLNKDLYVD